MTTTADLIRQDRLATTYGVQETGMPVGHEYHEQVSYDNEMSLREVGARGGRITRVRVLREGRYCDVSYVHATLRDGTIVPVRLSSLVGGQFFRLKADLIEWAREEGVYAKGLGLLDESNWSVLG